MDGLTRISGIGFIKRMLVVDDSPTICAVLGKMLGQDGYHVLKATDGATAIELARSELPALIFLDVVTSGRLPARETATAVNTLLSALSAESLDGIPDIAMPDAGEPGSTSAPADVPQAMRRMA